MAEFDSIEALAEEMKTKLDAATTKKKVIAVYAFNATGKTRLSNLLHSKGENWEVLEIEDWEILVTENGDPIAIQSGGIKTLCYNAFLEDMFTWDNENYILRFQPDSWIIKLVSEQGLEGAIIENFKDIYYSHHTKIEPSFDFIKWEVTFKIASGDDNSATNIKISKGEESMLIWSVFYTVLEAAIDAMNTSESDRTTSAFNDLQYIIIDDPVSSIDDTKIITMAIKLIEAIKLYQGNTVKFLITTHHTLFYNVLVNSFVRMRKKSKCDFESYSLSKINQKFELKIQDDSPFSYHLSVKNTIQTAITNNTIEKYHFNLFRNLLEKTSIFLGKNNWSDCIEAGENKEKLKHCLQIYSHSKLSELESSELPIEDKELLKETFATFIQHFNWN